MFHGPQARPRRPRSADKGATREVTDAKRPDPRLQHQPVRSPLPRTLLALSKRACPSCASFDVNDRKGLEITILTALLTFSDLNEAHHAASIPVPTPVPVTSSASAPLPQAPNTIASSSSLAIPPQTSTAVSLPASIDGEPPAVPPRPAPRTGVERVAEMHAVRNAVGEGDVNEVEVWEECDVMDYAQYAERLLNVSAASSESDRMGAGVRGYGDVDGSGNVC